MKSPVVERMTMPAAARSLLLDRVVVSRSVTLLGMDYLSMAMIFNATTEDEYNHWWMGYVERWNELSKFFAA